MFHIDDELKEFCESGVAVVVGTVDVSGRPRVCLGWGPRVHAGGTRLSVYLDRERAGDILAGLKVNPHIAMTIAHPVSFRSLQFKGHVVTMADPNDAEREWVSHHRNSFLTSTALVGESPEAMRNRWMEETVRVDFNVEQAFDQTPGPKAGLPL